VSRIIRWWLRWRLDRAIRRMAVQPHGREMLRAVRMDLTDPDVQVFLKW
jgi:hypothetical protein